MNEDPAEDTATSPTEDVDSVSDAQNSYRARVQSASRLGIVSPPQINFDLRPPSIGSTGERHTGWKLWLRDLFIAAAASVLIIIFLYQPVRVEGTSMLPRLVDQDRLFINKFVYHFTAIEHGDVVVFRYPRDEQKSYIKRVIGVPGDKLWIDRGSVYVNGKLLNEPYIPDQFRDLRSLDPIVIPAGEYFVMGDHRSISSDSREFGPVKRDLIFGKAAFVYWPTQDVGVVH